jgi:hypothetical protein
MLCKLAHEAAGVYSIPFQELLSEANAIFMSELSRFDQGKSSLTTWIYSKVRWGLIDYGRREIKRQRRFVSATLNGIDLELLAGSVQHEASNVLLESIRASGLIGAHAKELALLLASDLDESLASKIESCKRAQVHLRKALREHLINELNWEERHVDEAFSELSWIVTRTRP